jgi:hypothetical protein
MSGLIAKYLILYILTRKNCFSSLKSVFDLLKKITSKRKAKKSQTALSGAFGLEWEGENFGSRLF